MNSLKHSTWYSFTSDRCLPLSMKLSILSIFFCRQEIRKNPQVTVHESSDVLWGGTKSLYKCRNMRFLTISHHLKVVDGVHKISIGVYSEIRLIYELLNVLYRVNDKFTMPENRSIVCSNVRMVNAHTHAPTCIHCWVSIWWMITELTSDTEDLKGQKAWWESRRNVYPALTTKHWTCLLQLPREKCIFPCRRQKVTIVILAYPRLNASPAQTTSQIWVYNSQLLIKVTFMITPIKTVKFAMHVHVHVARRWQKDLLHW